MRKYINHNAPDTSDLPEVTEDEITLMRRIKRIVNEGHDVEVRKASDGSMKALEVSKRNIAIV